MEPLKRSRIRGYNPLKKELKRHLAFQQSHPQLRKTSLGYDEDPYITRQRASCATLWL